MKRILAISLDLFTIGKAHAVELTNSDFWSELPAALGFTPVEFTNFIASVNSIADLGAQFNWNTNENAVSDFDRQICDSLHMKSKAPMTVTFKELSLVFHFPNKKVVEKMGSKAEMDGSPNLIYENGKICRANTDEQLPATYIDLFDPSVKEPVAEVHLLLGVAPVANNNDVKYFHRSFWFVHKKNWERESHPHVRE